MAFATEDDDEGARDVGRVLRDVFHGAPLLGVNGITIIAHGAANARAVFSGISVAARLAEMNLNRRITDEAEAVLLGKYGR